jgi:hypothetical protein
MSTILYFASKLGKLCGIDLTILKSLLDFNRPLFTMELYALETNPIIPSHFLSAPSFGSI